MTPYAYGRTVAIEYAIYFGLETRLDVYMWPIATLRDVTTCPLPAKADTAPLTAKSQLARQCLFVEAAAICSQRKKVRGDF
jgi:hypothetical protein